MITDNGETSDIIKSDIRLAIDKDTSICQKPRPTGVSRAGKSRKQKLKAGNIAGTML